ncbi:hypothetical protein GCM10010470_14410 [Saccharopolyspora taberi]|uniref:Trp biosynthesis-associated membrane protein n=1 Tax=Saccharopolyspora taberi TaxID=60895 RepID=A0ABN3V762_9PSEU
MVLLLLAAAGLLWGSSAVTWVGQRFRTPFSGEQTSGVTGAVLRPELVPVALATLAAIAAVLATGGWLRRVLGALVVVAGGLLGWRVVAWQIEGWFAYSAPSLPQGSVPVSGITTNPAGPLLMSAGAVLLLVAGAVVLLRAGRLPAMGARYSAPGDTRRKVVDPDKKLWEALDSGEDPTVEQDR